MSQEIETLMPHDLINAKPVSAVVKEYFGSLAALAVHGPDEPALGGHAQASSLGPRAGRSDARARGLRSPRRSPDALRPHLPDRDAGRSEHRPHRVALDLRARQRVRLRRDAVPQGRATASVTDEVEFYSALEEEGTVHRPGERADRREGQVQRADSCRPAATATSSWSTPEDVDADGRRRRTSWSRSPRRSFRSSRTTTRTARSWARTCSARPCRSSAPHAPLVGTGIEGIVARDSGVSRRRQARRRRRERSTRRASSSVASSRQADERRLRRRHLQADQVPALEPEHLHQPEADRRSAATG